MNVSVLSGVYNYSSNVAYKTHTNDDEEPKDPSKYNEPAPLAACRAGDITRLQTELEKDRHIVYDYYASKSGSTIDLLSMAASIKNVEILEFLLRHGALADHATPAGATPLMYAAQSGFDFGVQKLLEESASVTQLTAEGRTPLFYAAEEGSRGTNELLLNHNANVNWQDKNGVFPLYIAAGRGHYQLVELFLEHKAKVGLSCPDGSTALHVAAFQNHLNIVKLLIKHNANVNECTRKGATALLFATQEGHNLIVEELLKYGANPEKKVKTSLFTKTSPLSASKHIAKNPDITNMLKKAIKDRKAESPHPASQLLSRVKFSYQPF
ncbi:ankyrin repeat domain-containing protein [uncultured Endozoicomonas sp.]|uniref:ankyrin repeat domain-containing protein n=1 Tax=uncultured Endozoicomonas sp. TaxID=432652 RepID=UPI00260B6B48|nr:ankyrin repeat domain-containing protein [uncultured Endozoicomonas sp.]